MPSFFSKIFAQTTFKLCFTFSGFYLHFNSFIQCRTFYEIKLPSSFSMMPSHRYTKFTARLQCPSVVVEFFCMLFFYIYTFFQSHAAHDDFLAHSPFGSTVSSFLLIDFLSPNIYRVWVFFLNLLLFCSNALENTCLHATAILGANRKCEKCWEKINGKREGRTIVNALLNWKIRNYCAIKKIYRAILCTQWNHKLFFICVLRCVKPSEEKKYMFYVT